MVGSIALSHQAPKKTVTKTEILAALKNLTAEERLEIIETASRMMREEISCHAFKLHIQGGRDAHPTRLRLFVDILFKCTTA